MIHGMTYDNKNRSALGWIASVSFIVGGLVWAIAASQVARFANLEFGPDVQGMAGAASWQSLGTLLLAVGVFALFLYLLAGSIGYDLRNQERAEPEPGPREL